LLGLRVRIPPGACLSVVSDVCCQVEVTASGLSLVQKSPTEFDVSECDRGSLDNERSLAHQRLPKRGKRKLALKWIINVVSISIEMLESRFSVPPFEQGL
jgi:hypothetical protein